MSMNAEIKAQWIADLRSGEYEQGRGYLNADGKLCCLGVLCEQAVRAGIIEAVSNCEVVFYDAKEDTLPDTVREWAGLPGTNRHGNPNNPLVTVGDSYVSLAELNDGEGSAGRRHTFDEIADLIDAQL